MGGNNGEKKCGGSEYKRLREKRKRGIESERNGYNDQIINMYGTQNKNIETVSLLLLNLCYCISPDTMEGEGDDEGDDAVSCPCPPDPDPGVGAEPVRGTAGGVN